MKNKIKVLRIIARLNIGGPARHVVILTEGLDKDKYDSILVYGDVTKGEGDMSGLAKKSGIRCVFLPEMSRSINPLGDLKAFFKILSAFGLVCCFIIVPSYSSDIFASL